MKCLLLTVIALAVHQALGARFLVGKSQEVCLVESLPKNEVIVFNKGFGDSNHR